MARWGSRRERGTAAVEFALVLPILLLLVGGIVDLGRAFMTQVILTNAAREGTRYAVVTQTGTPADVHDKIIARTVAAANGANGTATPTAGVNPYAGCVGSTADTTVTVTATTTFNWFFLDALPGTLPSSLTGQSAMRCK